MKDLVRRGQTPATDQLGRLHTTARPARIVGNGPDRKQEAGGAAGAAGQPVGQAVGGGPDRKQRAGGVAVAAGQAVGRAVQRTARRAEEDDDDLIDTASGDADNVVFRSASWMGARRSAGPVSREDGLGDASDWDRDGVEDLDENAVDEDRLIRGSRRPPARTRTRDHSALPKAETTGVAAPNSATADRTKLAPAGKNLTQSVTGRATVTRAGHTRAARSAGIFARSRVAAKPARAGASMSSAAAATTQAIVRAAAVARAVASAVAAMFSSIPLMTVVAVVVALVIAVITVISSVLPAIEQSKQQQQTGTCGTGTVTVPEQARPWMDQAARSSGLPAPYLAAIASRESDFRPDTFAADSNGGTWGLFQINEHEWTQNYGGGFSTDKNNNGVWDIKEGMIHAEYAGVYFKKRLETVRKMQQDNPDAAFAKLPETEALAIAHNAGEGNLQKYPNIPAITQSYLQEIRQSFQPGPCVGGGRGGVQPPSGKVMPPWPPELDGRMTSGARYGHYPSGSPHYGYDISGPPGTPILNICDGTVLQININGDYPNANAHRVSGSTNYLWIDCGNNVYMGYAHWYAKDLNPDLTTGQKIGAGTFLALEGNQGNSSGSHLHLQISTVGSTGYSKAETTDPAAYLSRFGIKLPAPYPRY